MSRLFKICPASAANVPSYFNAFPYFAKLLQKTKVLISKWLTLFIFRFIISQLTLFKVNNRNIRKRYEICSKLTIKTPERAQIRRSGVFIVYCFYC